MKRVLVTGAANIGKAGVATIIYKWGQEFDNTVLVYDYLMQRGLPDRKYQEKIKEKGGIIYTLPRNQKGILATIQWIKNIIKENKYQIIHINSDSAYVAAAYIYAAKRGGIKTIYVHSHCTQIDDVHIYNRMIKTIIHKMCKPYICYNSKCYLACSELAGIWMFGKRNVVSDKYYTIYNGVEVEKYLFDFDTRKQYREKLKLDGKFVIGNIGRFSYQKNHNFLIDVFSKLHKKYSDTVLVLIGTGEYETVIKEKVKTLNLWKSVIFLGHRDDVPQLLSAMDCLVMPSRFEGLPVTMVEAQMADLPCVVSGTITREAEFTSHVTYISSWNKEEWVEKIYKYKKAERLKNKEEKQESIFNIKNAVKKLTEILD